MHNEQHKLSRLGNELLEKERELVNFFRVAANPTVSKSNLMTFICIYNLDRILCVLLFCACKIYILK